MKKVLIVLLVAAAGWVGFQSYQAGEFSLYAGKKSPEEVRIEQLEKQIAEARARYKQAGRAAGVSGIDTTAQADAAMQEIKRLEKELAELRKKVGK
jgi:Tfp pilus assembly protein PilN